jgi:hypothetical protein
LAREQERDRAAFLEKTWRALRATFSLLNFRILTQVIDGILDETALNLLPVVAQLNQLQHFRDKLY